MRKRYAYGLSVCALGFFFSSRRRHTRFKCDWSSDVCSSDLSASTQQVYQLFGRPPSSELAAWTLNLVDGGVFELCKDTPRARIHDEHHDAGAEIGRASCRERV